MNPTPSPQPQSRRRFFTTSLKTGIAATVATASVTGGSRAMKPLERPGSPRLHTGLAAYSMRQYFGFSRDKAQKPPGGRKPITLFDFIDFCADHGILGAELTSYFFPPDVSDGHLLELRRHAFLRGVVISGTAVGNSFTLPKGAKRDGQIAYVRDWIDKAAVLGTSHIRIFAGGAASGQSADEARRLCVSAIAECCEYAGSKGIFLGIENHGGIVADAEGVLAIARAVDSPWFGVNLDTGNFHTDDPYGDLAKCAPYAVNVQVKAEIRPAGAKKSQPVDFNRIARILREANYQGFVTLEYEAREDPFQAIPPMIQALEKALATS